MPITAYKEDIDPRRWFVERIRQQAKTEGVELTPFEQEYLFHTEQGDDESASKMLGTIKGKGFEEFDKRISGLAWRRYQSDIQSDANAEQEYKLAMRRLANVDEYPNLSMFVNCIALEMPPEELAPRPLSWRALLIVALAVLAVIIFALLRR